MQEDIKICLSFSLFVIMVLEKKQLWKDADLKNTFPFYSKKIQNQNLFGYDKTYWP
jgi:hypothetical protein